jgi:hypothetical protein
MPEQDPAGQVPILLFDVDGVLNAVTGTDPGTWDDWQVRRAGGFRIRWSPSMIAALTRLSERVELRLLSTWWDTTEQPDFLGLPPMTVANTRDEYERLGSDAPAWWKLATVQRVHAEGRPIIWLDDDLAYNAEAKKWCASLPTGTLLGISPVTSRALEPTHLVTIEEWLDEWAPASRSPEPAPTC